MSDLPQQLAEKVAEALKLREAAYPSDGYSTKELHDHLVRVRASLDRVEGLQTDLVVLKGKVANKHAILKANYEDAWGASATSRRQSFSSDYSSAKERDAHHDLAAMKDKVALRQFEVVVRDVDTALEVVRTCHRGLDATRRDIDTRIRLLSVETQLER